MIGSVSGGCIEGAIIHEAKKVIAEKSPSQCHFGVTDEQAWEVGLTCGGEMTVLCGTIAMKRAILERLLERRFPAALVYDLNEHCQSVIAAGEIWGDISFTAAEKQRILAYFNRKESGLFEQKWFSSGISFTVTINCDRRGAYYANF